MKKPTGDDFASTWSLARLKAQPHLIRSKITLHARHKGTTNPILQQAESQEVLLGEIQPENTFNSDRATPNPWRKGTTAHILQLIFRNVMLLWATKTKPGARANCSSMPSWWSKILWIPVRKLGHYACWRDQRVIQCSCKFRAQASLFVEGLCIHLQTTKLHYIISRKVGFQ